jgi:hypothetical protein
VLWPLIPIGLLVGLAAMVLLALAGVTIMALGGAVWRAGHAVGYLVPEFGEQLMDVGGGITVAMFRAVERIAGMAPDGRQALDGE